MEVGRKMESIKRLRMTLVTVLIFLMIAGVTFLFLEKQMKRIPRYHRYSSSLISQIKEITHGEELLEQPLAMEANNNIFTDNSLEMAETASHSTDSPKAEETLPTAISRYVVDKHTVAWGECFSLITGDYWDDMFLWPDLYMLNDMKSGDPDLIYPNEVIEIFNRLGEGNNYSAPEKEVILDAYIDVYLIYKDLGEEKNNSAWSLLWCAAKYDKDFLDTYADRIDPADRAMAQKYIDEKGIIE
jgi:hypothetical protein